MSEVLINNCVELTEDNPAPFEWVFVKFQGKWMPGFFGNVRLCNEGRFRQPYPNGHPTTPAAISEWCAIAYPDDLEAIAQENIQLRTLVAQQVA